MTKTGGDARWSRGGGDGLTSVALSLHPAIDEWELEAIVLLAALAIPRQHWRPTIQLVGGRRQGNGGSLGILRLAGGLGGRPGGSGAGVAASIVYGSDLNARNTVVRGIPEAIQR